VSAGLRSVEDVVRAGLCTGCGLCESLAGREKIEMGLSIRGHMRPLVRGEVDAETNDAIMAVCPGVSVQGPGRPEGAATHPIWGPIKEVHRSWSAEPAVRQKAAAGGTLSGLGRYLLASGEVEAIVHVRARADRPWLTEAVVSRNPDEVLDGAQSRYGPSSPLIHVRRLLDEGTRFAVIAKPCDVSAMRALARRDARVDRQVPYLLTIFCGGVHHAHIPKAIMRFHGVDEHDVEVFRYRGEGWPGPLRVQTKDGTSHDMTYQGAWLDRPWSYDMQFRCKICPDAVGEVADVSVPDGWILSNGKPVYDDAPGTNLAVVRTERGRQLVSRAVAAGYLELAPVSMTELAQMHRNHPDRKVGGPAQAFALRLTGSPAPKVTGYRPWDSLREAGTRITWQQFRGTLRRIRNGDNREPTI
jgi:coenzyme F420 hydrogenase subunit beta